MQKKKYLNAIVTSNFDSIPKDNPMRKYVEFSTYTYALLMFFAIAGSLLFSAFIHYTNVSQLVFEIAVFILLLIDFFSRLITANIRSPQIKWVYLRNFFRVDSLMLLAALLPSLYLVGKWTSTDIAFFNTVRGLSYLRIFRLILLLNIFSPLRLFINVLHNERKTLMTIFFIITMIILLFSLGIYTIEQPNAVEYLKNNPNITQDEAEQAGYIFTYWQAIYYSTITLTTIGFGDLHPHTTMGQVLTTFMSIVGIAVVATPTGVIAGGFLNAIKARQKEEAKLASER